MERRRAERNRREQRRSSSITKLIESLRAMLEAAGWEPDQGTRQASKFGILTSTADLIRSLQV